MEWSYIVSLACDPDHSKPSLHALRQRERKIIRCVCQLGCRGNHLQLVTLGLYVVMHPCRRHAAIRPCMHACMAWHPVTGHIKDWSIKYIWSPATDKNESYSCMHSMHASEPGSSPAMCHCEGQMPVRWESGPLASSSTHPCPGLPWWVWYSYVWFNHNIPYIFV